MLNEGVVFAADRASYHCGVGRGLLVVKLIALAAGAALDALEAPHEVEVPIAATEFAISDYLQPSGFLLCHQISDRNVFDGLELIGIDGTRLKISTCLLQHIGSQEAANYIAAKRCVFSKSNSHVGFLVRLI